MKELDSGSTHGYLTQLIITSQAMFRLKPYQFYSWNPPP
ncbi:Uncharacterised protein [Segatella copri]|nr:Uncharacterised protein [Segatella copri]